MILIAIQRFTTAMLKTNQAHFICLSFSENDEPSWVNVCKWIVWRKLSLCNFFNTIKRHGTRNNGCVYKLRLTVNSVLSLLTRYTIRYCFMEKEKQVFILMGMRTHSNNYNYMQMDWLFHIRDVHSSKQLVHKLVVCERELDKMPSQLFIPNMEKTTNTFCWFCSIK